MPLTGDKSSWIRCDHKNFPKQVEQYQIVIPNQSNSPQAVQELVDELEKSLKKTNNLP